MLKTLNACVGGIVDTSTVDWYGDVSIVVFFAGCNFRCPYCQNPSLIPLDSGVDTSLEAIQKRIESNRSLLDSVVFTGGEPSLQPEPLIEASRIAKKLGLKVMVNSNGSRPKCLERLISEEIVDRVALDLKAPLNGEVYGVVCGLPDIGWNIVKNVEDSLKVCWSSGVELEIRTTVAPTLSDDPLFIKQIASVIKGKCDVYYLQQFDNLGDVLDPSLKRLNPPSIEVMESLAKIAVEEGVEDVYIKTRERGLKRID